MAIALTPIPSQDTLISTSRAEQVASLAALSASNPDLLASYIAAASGQIRRYCHRTFNATQETEYRDGDIYTRRTPLRLRQFPVLSIARVACATRAILVQYNGAAQIARVETTTSGITLTSILSGVTTTTSLAFADYATVALLSTAISAVSGWSVAVQSGSYGSYGGFPSNYLRQLQGAANAKLGGTYLDLYEDVQPLGVGYGSEEMNDDFWGFATSSGWRLDAATGELAGRFPRGQQNLLIVYTAGFSAVPDAVQEACVQLTLHLYNAGVKDFSVSSESTDGYTYSASPKGIPPVVKSLLAPYIAHDRVMHW